MTAVAVKTGHAHDAPPVNRIGLERCSIILGVSKRRIRQMCLDWSRAGLAKKVGCKWLINPEAHPRLADSESFSARDVRQITELRKAGMTDQDIDHALIRRRLVVGFESFGPRTGTGKKQRLAYLQHIRAIQSDNKHAVPSERTLRRWIDGYFTRGLCALAPKRSTRESNSSIGQEAWELFVKIVGTGHGMKVTHAFDQVTGYRIEKGLTDDSAWAWPSLRSVQRAYRDRVSKPMRTYTERGPRKFRALCIPKITRDWSVVSAGDVLVGDERTFDFFARVESDRGPRAVRLKLTAWLCPRSNYIPGWYIGKLANSDTIMSSFKAACLTMSTLPRAVIIDNGTDYKAVGGKPRRGRKWDTFDEERLASAFGAMEIDTHYAIPYAPWAKPIESIFRNLSEFDRFAASYTGGKPDERPHDADRWIKANIDKLPAIDEVRSQFSDWLEAYHTTPQRGGKLNNLSPRQAFEKHFTASPTAVSEPALEFLCCRRMGPIKVGRDGVRVDGILYGQRDIPVWRMQGRDVWVMLDPARADRVTLCDAKGVPLCTARADRLSGATREDLRESIAFQRRCEKIIRKEAPPARRYSLMTAPARIANRKRLAAKARQIPDADLAKRPAAQSVRVVRPDVEHAVAKLKKAEGAQAIEGLARLNAGADALNNGAVRNYINFSEFADDADDLVMDDQPARPIFDYAACAREEEDDEI